MFTTVYCSGTMEESIICNSRKEFLIKGEIIDKQLTTKKYLTRSDCVKIASKLENFDEYTSYSHDKLNLSELFHDMPESRDDYDTFFNMYFLSTLGRGIRFVYLSYIYGDENGMRPDDLITWSEFITLFLRVINWDVYIYLQKENDLEHFMNSYPDKYFEIAEKLGITSFKRDGYVQTEDAWNFIYCILQVPIICGFGFATPDSMTYGPASSWADTIYIDRFEELERIKNKYMDIGIDESLIGKYITVYDYHNTAIMINDPVMIDTSWVPAETKAHGIIGFPELSWWFVNKKQ